MKSNKSLAFLGILLVLMVQIGCAVVGFDDFSVSVDPSEINVSDSFEVTLTFHEPDDTDSVTAEIEILVDGVTVFLDKEYDNLDFTKGEDETVTFSSDDFPGPDLDSDYFNDNLMNYACGKVDVEVRVSGDDLTDEYSDEDSLTIGDDAKELKKVEMEPSTPLPSDKVVVTVFDEDNDELKGAKVKVTWLDDPNGDKKGEWDSDDKKSSDTTNSDGEASFIIEDEFGADAEGKFQMDVYVAGYCLERKTFEVASGQLTMNYTPIKPASGEPISICVKNSKGTAIPAAAVYVYGPGHSKTYTTGSTGCVSVTLSTLGTYRISASKDGYEASLDNLINIGEKTTTSTTTTTTSTSFVATTQTTTTTKPAEKLFIFLSDMTPYANETVKILVKDVQSRPVKGITISISPSDVKGKTNDDGIFYFTPESSGKYMISATSESSAYSSASEEIEAMVPRIPDKTPTDSSSGISSINPILLLVAGLIFVVLVGIIIILLLIIKRSRTEKAKRKDWSNNKPERWISIKDDTKEE